jgi:imidazolonepropionase-like amidohydrolase
MKYFFSLNKLFKLSLFLIAVTPSVSINAQDYLIKNATIHTASEKGVLNKTDIYISDGFIMQVGKNLTISQKHSVIDAKEKHVTPGLMNASTHIGIVEIDAASSTVDSSTKNEMHGASFTVAPAINFRSTIIPQNRINGLTRAIVRPSGGTSIFQGQAAAIALMSSKEGLLNENVAQFARYGNAGARISGGSRGSAYAVLDKALNEANYLRHNRNQYKLGFDWHFSQSIDDLDALKKVLERKIPLVINVHRSDDISRMLTLAKKHSINLVVSGASEAWMVADELANANVPVLIDPILNLPSSFESLASRLDAAAILNEAGVKLIFTGVDWQSTHNGYLVRQSAGNAVAYGMPEEEAIKAMSINTAEVFGIKNYGQIKVGMEADIVIWDGAPLELTSNPDMVFIKGVNQPMVSRATRLRDRYWDLKNIQKKAFTR